ncbi:hypothetical protein [Sulfurimonas paralvinellae]|uniref:Uncharacterized protein n=1 Tax=Sulfurimonas paralvinellae TaxID=317658 RepID=A0A7M1B5P3_9BACT|nr:hypothetical protein [Sulfurimonas paralvinellae]QOP44965.1 hypothetical protein FM071_01080 [Sulfurimonas paralvinellae]
MIKKHKNKIILALMGLLLMSVYIFFTTWQERTYKEVHTMYPLEKSKNPKASEEFLKAMEYRIYIKELHPYFDYNSFVMAPLLMKMNYHFKKGVALLPKDSVEDIVWWTLFYKEIYGLLVPPRNDNSMAYENLPPKEFTKVHDAIYRMIMRYPEGKVYFDIPERKTFRFKVMAILVGFYYGEYSDRYIGNTDKDRAEIYAIDHNVLKNLQQVLDKYHLAYNKYINQVKDRKFMDIEYTSDVIAIETTFLAHYTFVNNIQKLPVEICNSKNVYFMIDNSNKIFNHIINNTNYQARYLEERFFKDTSNFPVIMKLLQYRCPNLQPEITQVVQKIDQLNQTKNKK